MASDVPLSGSSLSLTDGWELRLTKPGAATTPEGLATLGDFSAAIVPGTAAQSLSALGRWSFDAPRDFDAEDVWYRTSFAGPARSPGSRVRLCFDGLATFADVFLNGAPILSTDNMFRRHVVDVTAALRDSNELAIRFRALAPELKLKKARPRYRTKLVQEQQLRFVRTTLLGRMPGWSPPVAPVGPYCPVRLEVAERALLESRRVRARLAGAAGIVSFEGGLTPLGGATVASASISVDGVESALALRAGQGAAVVVTGEASVAGARPWWPHTHGESPRSSVELLVRFGDGAVVRHDCSKVGFRDVTVDATDGGFELVVNGVPVFCRGACWTPLDVVALRGTPEQYRAALELARRAGMNMIRVGGTMLYEDDVFYDLCDELGILVWHDFMFANMDYPVADEAFAASVAHEVKEQIERLAPHPSVAVFCGNSEVEQQAAMVGQPPAVWTNDSFSKRLPEAIHAARSTVPYVPSTPTGGPLPFSVGTGVSHYYGVGAYQRPLEDARRAGVRFTPECLGFANVPEEAFLDRMTPDGAPPPHHPAWKSRVPRDRGTGWDFDDVRDHYMELLFGGRFADLRYADPERYRELARLTSGEVMSRTFGEWRRPGSTCKGALVWFYKDLWPGAGWGLLDSSGAPKAAYFYLRRALQPLALVLTDEGLDGVALHVVNERAEEAEVELTVELFRHGETKVAGGSMRRTVAARGDLTVPTQAFFETFHDVGYAYRFGPPSHDLVVATLTDVRTPSRRASAFHFPVGLPRDREPSVGLDAVAERSGPNAFTVTVSTRRFAEAVSLQIRGGAPEDSYFHLAPGERKRLIVAVDAPAAALQGTVRAANSHAGAKIRVAVPGT